MLLQLRFLTWVCTHFDAANVEMASPLLLQRSESRREELDFSINGLLVNPFRDKDLKEMERLIADFFEFANIGKWVPAFRTAVFILQASMQN